MCLVTGVWNEGEMSPGGREMATSSGEREERLPGLMTVLIYTTQNIKWDTLQPNLCLDELYAQSYLALSQRNEKQKTLKFIVKATKKKLNSM